MTRLVAFLCGHKGLAAMRALRHFPPDRMSIVVARDPGLDTDPAADIERLAREHGAAVTAASPSTDAVAIAVGWKRLIRGEFPALYVVHDSLLPKLRGWNPLVTALVQGEPRIGATLFLADEGMDTGPIIDQVSTPVEHPMRIDAAIDLVCEGIELLVAAWAEQISLGHLPSGTPQDESLASYSLWRDEDDYEIDWHSDADRIVRHIFASGSPYAGARTVLDGEIVIVSDARALPDPGPIANRTPGKIFGHGTHGPLVICGHGIVELRSAVRADSGTVALPAQRLRQRLG